MEKIQLLNANPLDPAVQSKIAEDIRQQNIQENMNMAIEEAPESFAQVVMLWINIEVNGHSVKGVLPYRLVCLCLGVLFSGIDITTEHDGFTWGELRCNTQ